ncbi:MAG: hypothetical protein AAF667_15220 [Pseudomonadota bacterium]
MMVPKFLPITALCLTVLWLCGCQLGVGVSSGNSSFYYGSSMYWNDYYWRYNRPPVAVTPPRPPRPPTAKPPRPTPPIHRPPVNRPTPLPARAR